MLRFRILLLLILFICSNTLLAQQNFYEFKGSVKDLNNLQLEGVSILLINKIDNSIIHYTATDATGKFSLKSDLSLFKLSDLILRARLLGYKFADLPVNPSEDVYNFILKEDAIQLEDIVIKGAKPKFKISGDTITYQVRDFASAQDRTISDVLKKIPGMSVEDNGLIKYNGKNVTKLYLEGDDLLGGRYNLGTRTIPQNYVNEIQVLENHQHIKMLEGKVFSDNVDINLTFKDEAKLKLVGQLQIGGGFPSLYEEEGNVIALKKKYKAIQTLKLNNTGKELSNDILDFNKFKEYTKRGYIPDASQLSTGGQTSIPLANDKYIFNNSMLINSSNLWKLKNDYQLKSRIFHEYDNQDRQYTNHILHVLPGQNLEYTDILDNSISPKTSFGDLVLLINNSKSYLSNAVTYEYNSEKTQNASLINNNPLNQIYSHKAYSFSNEFELIRLYGKKALFTYYSYQNYQNKPENLLIDSLANVSIFRSLSPLNNINQQLNVPTYFTNNYINLVLSSKKLSQTYRLGVSAKIQNLSSALQANDAFTKSLISPEHLKNSTQWNQYKLNAESQYEWRIGSNRLTFKLPMFVQHISYTDTLNTNKQDNRFIINPNITFSYSINRRIEANFSYVRNNEVGNIFQAYQNIILNNYRSLNQNEALLGINTTNRIGSSISYKNPLELLFFNLDLYYQHTKQNNISASSIDLNRTIFLRRLFDNQNNNYNLNAGFSKYLFAINSTIKGAYSTQFGQWNQIVNNIALPYNNIGQSINLNFTGNFKEKLRYDSGIRYMRNKSFGTKQSVFENSNITQAVEYSLMLNYNITDKLFFTASNTSGFNKRNDDLNSRYNFIDFNVKFKPNKTKIDFEIEGKNLANNKNFQVLNLSSNNLSEYNFPLRPRTLLFKATFIF
jgi:hypothetical protein